MMEKFIVIISFIAKWLLFAFPLYQAYIELSEQERVVGRFTKKSKKYPKISPWYWILPPLKLELEKKRGIAILSESLISNKDFEEAIVFGRKATAWFYVALAGMLEGITAIYELAHAFDYHISFLMLILLSVLMVIICVVNIRHRIKNVDIKRFREKLKETRKK
ncbi:hypothetical protein BG262_08285 [Floricoccus penangensis]|uniref:Glycosyl-4,4'-diaponeurosporenoate acyltransferase n=2 Tax=Floricoccus penangensis TaxID=1859475 RepID=A0A9Q5JHJ5_9LACT|nr:hypothetical protein BG262_08285 [Floricoccus penangensis]